MEPTQALRSIETALRLVVRDVLGGSDWLAAVGAPEEERLRSRQVEENKRRDGAIVSEDLLDYTETYHLTELIQRNWEKFQPVFKDRQRTLAYFGVINDVRNSVAHSRELVPFERDLISGIAGQIRNQVSVFRSGANRSTKYYPLIESIKDNFGHEGHPLYGVHSMMRLEVGDVLTFTASAFNANGRNVKWQLTKVKGSITTMYLSDSSMIDVAEGDSVSFAYTVVDEDIGETFSIAVRIAAESRYHRYMDAFTNYDDVRVFIYAVNPPDED